MNLLKLMGSLGNIGKIKAEAEAAAEELKRFEYTGTAGGGMVTVKVSGAGQMLTCTIDPQLVADGDKEMIEELVVAATNQAATEAKRKSAEFMQQRMAERLDMPELANMLGGLMPK